MTHAPVAVNTHGPLRYTTLRVCCIMMLHHTMLGRKAPKHLSKNMPREQLRVWINSKHVVLDSLRTSDCLKHA